VGIVIVLFVNSQFLQCLAIYSCVVCETLKMLASWEVQRGYMPLLSAWELAREVFKIMGKNQCICPECKSETDCFREEADVGVGIIYGPYGCYNCGWSEDKYYDKRNGKSEAEKDNPNFLVTSRGAMYRK